jgi:membrane-bound lytic murein transglycosylase MltF
MLLPLARVSWLAVIALSASACSRETPQAAPAAAAPTAAPEPVAADPAPEATPYPAELPPFAQPWKGDLDGMAKRRVIRVLTVQNPVIYFVDRGREGGTAYEGARAFEEFVNKRLNRGHLRIHAVMLPVSRERLIPALNEGLGDIAAAQLTVTPERQRQVEFSRPFVHGVAEILVTGPAAPTVASLDDLAGQDVFVRATSSYAESLRARSGELKARGLEPIGIVPAEEALEDGDILEMVSAGLVPMTVVDDFTAQLWSGVLGDLRLHPQIALRQGGEIAWAFRKGSPKLRSALDVFVKGHAQGTKAGNIVINKYLKTTRWVRNARSEEDMRRFRSMAHLFQQYSDRYEFDWLLMAAQGYQESQLDQSRRSHVGAIGVMQVMPSTARDKNVGIPDIERLESNIHAGVKYMRFIVDQYFADEKMDRMNKALFAFASYNAGPARVSQLRREAEREGLDPNRWFNNVEVIAARRIGRETVQYVSNIYKYYVAYTLAQRQQQARDAAKTAAR